MNRRKFIIESSILASTALFSGTLLSFTHLDEACATEIFDVVIIGGSYSGLSAAMALGRSLRNVLIIDNGMPSNRKTPHSHNFITQDGETPGDITRVAKAQVLTYETVLFHQDTAINVLKTSNIFTVTTQSGKVFSAKKVLFATGLKDIMPAIPGFSDCWGISILHCPYCHGYEVKNQETGILGNGSLAFHYTQLVSNLTHKLHIFTNGQADFNTEQQQLIRQNKISVVTQKVLALEHHNGRLIKIHLEDHSSYPLTALYARPAFEQHSKIPMVLGCTKNEQGLLVVDSNQQTNIFGIYACGDTSAFRSVATAVATGSQAGAAINMALSTENFNLKE